MKCPCRDCPNRTLTCHGFCKEYKAWKDWREEVNRKKAAESSTWHSRNHELNYRRSLKAGWK